MKEKWRNIKGYEGLYQISNKGRVKSLSTIKNEEYIIMQQRENACGYPRINLSCCGVQKTYEIHRLVATHFIDNPLNKKEVNHKDGNKRNNNASNLEWVNRRENMLHAFKNGLCPGKIEIDLHKARKLLQKGYSTEDLGIVFGCSSRTVRRRLNGE